MAVLDREQQSLVGDVDLDPYRGTWVAIRDGEVIASDVDPIALRDNPDVRSDDFLTLVPTADEGMLLL